MVIDANLFVDGPIFAAPTRVIERDGLGEVVEEWGTPEFAQRFQQSFRRAVNNALEQRGLPRCPVFFGYQLPTKTHCRFTHFASVFGG
jgi:hypothetical protein